MQMACTYAPDNKAPIELLTNIHSHVLDLHDALPYDSTHAKYWDDAVHFTPAGYDLIGDKIGTVITSLIVAERAQGTL